MIRDANPTPRDIRSAPAAIVLLRAEHGVTLADGFGDRDLLRTPRRGACPCFWVFLSWLLFRRSSQARWNDAKAGFLERLLDRYSVLLVDYPSIGRSADIAPTDLTISRVLEDMHSVADAAGFREFAYWGYSWGAAVGLQLAARSNRLRALVMGGWPPLGAQYENALKASIAQMANPPPEVQVVLRSPAQYAQWATFYASLQDFDEGSTLVDLDCPRMAFAGADGDTHAGDEPIENAAILRANRKELQSLGWTVTLIPDAGHEVGLNPEIVVPVVREFLDDALPDA